MGRLPIDTPREGQCIRCGGAAFLTLSFDNPLARRGTGPTRDAFEVVVPGLKCRGCSLRYRWTTRRGWIPLTPSDPSPAESAPCDVGRIRAKTSTVDAGQGSMCRVCGLSIASHGDPRDILECARSVDPHALQAADAALIVGLRAAMGKGAAARGHQVIARSAWRRSLDGILRGAGRARVRTTRGSLGGGPPPPTSTTRPRGTGPKIVSDPADGLRSP